MLALLGIWGSRSSRASCLALNPLYGIAVLSDAPWRGFVMLGAVFLAVTGTETLYADMGHFGRTALRTAWLRLVFPALVLNYFGQGALLLGNPAALENPFYRLAPGMGPLPARGTGLDRDDHRLAGGDFRARSRSPARRSSSAICRGSRCATPRRQEIGQVYVPRINSGLLVAIIILVLGFRSSDNLGAAYGIAVSGMMAITTGLAFLYMRSQGWSLAIAVPVFAVFGLVDLTFLSANLLKIAEGGWFPIVVAALVFAMMGTWWRGRRLLAEQRARDALPLSQFVEALNPEQPGAGSGNGDLHDPRPGAIRN